MNTRAPAYFYPNRMGQIFLLAMEEVLGCNELKAVLSLAFLPESVGYYPLHDRDLNLPFEHFGRMQNALENAYGSRGGRGLALQAGRACFKYGLREFGSGLGLTDLAFRMLPLPVKLKLSSEAFSGLFNHSMDQHIRLETDEKFIHWHIERCPLCWERKTDSPYCHLAAGLLQEALYWVSGGKHFLVKETGCIACGDSACTIVIDQTPIN
jgi:predicted hydrocarbon binding protein